MAYPHGKVEYMLLGTGAGRPMELLVTATTAEARWGAGYMPFLIRAVSIQNTVTTAASGCVVSFRHTDTYGAAQVTGNEFTTITIACGDAPAILYYRDDFTPREIVQGAKVTAVASAVAAGESYVCRVYGEWNWESPANSTGQMVTG